MREAIEIHGQHYRLRKLRAKQYLIVSTEGVPVGTIRHRDRNDWYGEIAIGDNYANICDRTLGDVWGVMDYQFIRRVRHASSARVIRRDMTRNAQRLRESLAQGRDSLDA